MKKHISFWVLFASAATYVLGGWASDPACCVDAQYVPERMDDFCWENPYCGMRTYGPKVAQPRPAGEGLVSSGIDVFSKGTREVVMVETIRRALKGGPSYHTPNGRCFDTYKVSVGSGCGGVVRLLADGTWQRSGNWMRQRVLEKTRHRAVFELEYDAYTLRGTVTAGTPFVRFDVEPKGAGAGGFWGPGLDVSVKRGHGGLKRVDAAAGYAANYEPKEANGTMSAVVLDPACGPAMAVYDETGCLCLLAPHGKITFYAGAAWAGAGAFPTAESWFAYVAEFAKNPVAMCTGDAAVRTEQERMLKEKLPEIFEKSEAHYRLLEAAAQKVRVNKKGENCTPHGWKKETGRLDMRDVTWWTSGHFPGSLWYLYEATGKEEWKARAVDWTATQAPMAHYTGNHDIGFMMYCSVGNGRRLLPEKQAAYDAQLIQSARSLCKRYHDGLGLIRSWGKIGEKKSFRVIPDNMMNLELLMWASKQGAPDSPRFREVAVSHADVSMRNHFRVDGGTYHVLNYDQASGRVKEILRGQGASCLTAWSRGQSWAIYGFTMMFRETGKRAYLDFAVKLSDYAIRHPNMPADGVPYWDFGAPGEERDTSAASVMASGLLELARYVPAEKGAFYRAFAVKQLLALASPAYFAAPGENGNFLLKHGVGHKPGNSEIDVPLDYGDYYFLEALLRFKK